MNNQSTTEHHSTEPQTTKPTSEQLSNGNSVLAIVLGIFGGLIVLLLIIIAILGVFIISKRLKVVQQTSAIQEHRYVDLLHLYAILYHGCSILTNQIAV